ncbi:hypothetical protein BDN71DRAFT_1510940 [Pleurotus eryngii]|uniref:Uncharacterized protein n=1 Tax=Pleurotus eryngii TaxID=5323 RepID=A0A9P6D4K6_PLEER|nr:hypothetical protein BDN71DRAFT_1510940 [Pleurotus eryngii]
MPLISCDPDDPNGGCFSVIGCNGRCEVLVDREGCPNLVYTANNDDQTAQVEDLMTQMTLNRNIITVVVSDSEDEDKDEGAPKTPKHSQLTNFTVDAGAQHTPASPIAPRFQHPHSQHRNAQLLIPSPPGTLATPRNTLVLRTPDLSLTKTSSTTISSPSSLAETLFPLIFAAPSPPPFPSPPVITCHPTAPPYTGHAPSLSVARNGTSFASVLKLASSGTHGTMYNLWFASPVPSSAMVKHAIRLI